MELKAYIEYEKRTIEGHWKDGGTIVFEDIAELDIKEQVDSIEACYKINRDGSFRFFLTFISSDPLSHVFIPSVWYRGNNNGEGLFPKESKATFWSFLETRMSLPGFIIFITANGHLKSSIESSRDERFISAVSWFEHGITYSIPGKEGPYSYRGKTALVDTSLDECFITLNKGDSFSRRFYISSGPEKDELKIYESYVRAIINPNLDCDLISWHDYYESKLTRLLNLTHIDECGNAYIKMGEDNGKEQSVYEYTSASFLVKSVEAATAFASINSFSTSNVHLQSALDRIKKLFGTNDLKVLAKRIGDHFLAAETYPGVFQDCESLISGERGGYLGIGEHPEFMYLVNSRCCGEAMCSYIKLYSILKEEKYLALAKRVANFFITNQLDNGSYGRWWDKNGNSISASGTNGAYIAVFLIKLLNYLEEDEKIRVKESIDRALEYYQAMAANGDFFGDTLDADSADKEAGVSLLSLFLEAMESFGINSKLLNSAKHAASFIITWVWHKNSFIPRNSRLGQTGFMTKGMTSVSIAHHHLDFYGMLIAKDFLRLYKFTNDSFYRDESLMMLSACRQLIDLGPGDLQRKLYGYQPEQINHTAWDYFSREDHMNGTYDIDIAWNNVLGLSSYLYIKENFPEALI